MYKGKAVQLLIETHNAFKLNIDALKSVLENNKIKDKHVVLISIAGELRGGKSFMLDFFLRYLQSKDKQNWLNNVNESLTGFSWKNGDERDTTGILLWSEPHLVTFPNGEEYAVLLMDTQGTFDKKSSVKKNAMIFALSAMVSSIQIFNVRRQILEDKLQFLRLFTCYGQLAMTKSDNKAKPFQHLHFLVRDWPCPYKNPFGMDGGKSYLEKVLHVDESTDAEVIDVRKFIEQCYSRIDCCLFPNPGMKVMNSEIFDGKIIDIEAIFVEILSKYVPQILSPEYMLPKAINGAKVTCLELLEYFKAYFKVFDSDEMPQPVDIFKATTEASLMASLKTCQRFYAEEMDKICKADSNYLSKCRLEKEHSRVKLMTVKKFNSAKKFGDQPEIDVYQNVLEKEIEKNFEIYVERNGQKNMVGSEVWSLVVLFIWFLVIECMKQVVMLCGMETAEGFLSWVLFVIGLSCLLWIGAHFSGSVMVKMYMDEVLSNSWDYILRPLFLKFKKAAISSVVRNT